MGLRTLDKISREFQTEQTTKPAEYKSPAITAESKIKGIKTLDEIIQEFQAERRAKTGASETADFRTGTALKEIFGQPAEPDKQAEKKKRGIVAVISDILFYLAILTVLVSVLTSGQNGAPKMFMGYSYFTVLTSSMHDEIPRGSFIIVHKTDPRKLNTGDNITYMRDASTSVTHKINKIYENYRNSGTRGFQTKGVNNAEPDREIVYEANIVGKVILAIPGAGAVISALRADIYIVFIIFILCVILSFLIRILFANPKKKTKPN